ncbi:hypothetical protein OIU34_27845 [Pararhizobium sp. BT-229]|uniref:hypothetical protein n=1 Tax=Pararhizobium sp. BT-229 TaxID=2986923 RepID=UPI0021F7F7E2|nr:hypothetical protein [Pararhizobium sp. BT-229]MCV9965691.1 hypothetical protein [Pararhizobium sp. BT-229]
MSLRDLRYLDESQADTVTAAVHQRCAENESEISSHDGETASADRLAQSADTSGPDLLRASSQEIATTTQPSIVHSVLVLEAEPFIALDIEVTLEEVGLPVQACFTRTEALQWLTSNTPSAAVLDYQLRDGVCTDVASLLKTRGVPIIFCSGANPREVVSVFGEASWLPKPFDYQQLTDLVRQALEMRDVPQQLEKEA